MKNNRLTIVVAAVLVVIAGVLIWNNRYLSTIQGEASDFMVWDTASVTKIYLADRQNNESLLERQPEGWVLNGSFKGHPKQINALLSTLYKIRIRMPVSKASHDNILKQLTVRSTKVEIYQNVPRINLFDKVKLFYHEKRTKVFYVGDANKDNSGSFMLKEGADKAYIVYIPGFRGFVSTRFTANPNDWRDHVIYNSTLADIQSVSVEFGANPQLGFRIDNVGKHQYKLTRLADNAELPIDTLKVINLLSSFSDLRFEAFLNDILPQKRIDSITTSPFLHLITLNTKDGKSTQMKTFIKRTQDDTGMDTPDDFPGPEGMPVDPIDHDRLYALINDGHDFVLIQYYIFDKIFRDVDYYQAGNPLQYEIDHYQILE